MQRALRYLCLLLPLIGVAQAQKSTVVTIAGGYLGNNRPALSASFNLPAAVAFDSQGAMYIADARACLIRKIDKQGSVSVVAGTGICGFSGDGGHAKAAMLNEVRGLVFDAQGDLLFADSGNERIRKISPSGLVSTIAGNGTFGYSGDGGPASAASLGFPEAITLDAAGNLYIGDTDNFVVRLVDTSGVIHTVAGNHTNGYSGDGGPATAAQMGVVQGVAVDANGLLYIAETSQHVRRVDSAGIIATVAGNGTSGNTGDGGPGTSAAIGFVEGLLFNSGVLYITSASSVWSLDLSSGLIHLVGNSSLAQGFGGDGGPATFAFFNFPLGMGIDFQGNLFVADSENNRIRKITAGSQIVNTVAGGFTGDGRRGSDAALNLLFGGYSAFDAKGNLYIADTFNHRVRKLSNTGVMTTVAGTGTSGYSGDNGPAMAAQLWQPTGVAVDSSGNLFIADSLNGQIRKVDSAGTITTLAVQGPGFFGRFIFGPTPTLAMDTLGNLYLSDALWAVWKIDPFGNAIIVARTEFSIGYGGDGGPATQAQLNLPTGIALDSTGNLYIADWLSNRIRKVDSAGTITTVAGTGVQGFFGDGGPATAANLDLPEDVAVDATGNLYIADWLNFRIRKVDVSGTITTIAGTGMPGYNGNRLPAGQTNMFPIAVTVGPDSEVYYSDYGAYRVRKITN